MPSSDTGVRDWGANFSLLVEAQATQLGVPETTAEDLRTKFTAYNAALTKAIDPATRGKAVIFTKNATKKAFVAFARSVAQQIATNMDVSDLKKLELGLTVRSTSRTPVPAPSERPFIKVAKVDGRTVTLRLQQDSERRSKPAKVAGATIFVGYGSAAPQTMADWEYYTATGRTTVEIDFPPSATGDTVWITAFWQNAKDESGPAAFPVSISLPAGGVLPKAQEMKLAA
jgi:hypothetical protein